MREKFKYPLFLFFLTIIFFNKIFFYSDQMLASGDIIGIFAIEKWLFSTSIHKYHILPIWNPYIFSGVPFVANPQAAMFYPINILFLIFNTNIAFGYVFGLDIFLISLFTYLFARKINLNKFSAFISAFIFGFGSTVFSRVIPGHLFYTDAVVWFPLLLFFCEDIVQKEKIIYGVFAGITLSLMLLSGDAQFTVYALSIATLYVFLRVIGKKDKFKKVLFIFFGAVALSVALASVQLLPTLEFTKLSIRSSGLPYDFASSFSLHPIQLLTSVLPYFFGASSGLYWGKGNFHENSLYEGIIPIILSSLAIIYGIRKNSYVQLFSLFIIVSLLYSFGKYTPFFYFFYKYIPFFNSFRVPERFLYFYSFSITILSGIGTQYLLEKNIYFKVKKGKTLKFLTFLIFFFGLIGLFLLAIFSSKNGLFFYNNYILRNRYAIGLNHYELLNLLKRDLFFLSFFLFSFLFTLFFLKKKAVFKILISLLIISDLFIYSNKFIQTKKPEAIFTIPTLIKQITYDHDQFRVLDLSGKLFSLFFMHGIYSATGIHSLQLKTYKKFLLLEGEHDYFPYESFFSFKPNITNVRILSLLNIKYVVSQNPITNSAFEEVYKESLNMFGTDTLFYLYKNKTVFPRAYFVANAEIINNTDKLLTRLLDKKFNPENTVLLESKANIPLINKGSFKKIRINEINPNLIKLSFGENTPGFLILSEISYPGWKAYDNGKEVQIYTADYLFRSLALKRGKHNIEFIFKPLTYEIGKYISVITLIMISVYFICYKGRLLPEFLE